MIYPLSLYAVGLAVGLLLIVAHVMALVNEQEVRPFLRRLPRSVWWGRILLTVDAVWAFGLILTVDLGEFTSWRQIILLGIVGAYLATVFFVEEFLAVRALGILLLLAAEPLLEASFLHPQTSRLLLTLLAYAWATVGMFWVGMPYLLRDQIGWVTKTDLRWKAAAFGGIAYGVLVLGCALTQWR